MTALLEPLERLITPTTWPVFWRRMWLVCLPVTLPIWVILWVALILVLVVLALAWIAFEDAVKPLSAAVSEMWRDET